MADMKQYITQVRENGNVMISEDVIAAVVARSISEVEGVVSLDVKPGSDIAELIGKKNWGKGVKIVITENNELVVDCNVTVGYGQNVVDVAKLVQDAIMNAIEDLMIIPVKSVNVNVSGIIRQ